MFRFPLAVIDENGKIIHKNSFIAGISGFGLSVFVG